MSGSFLLSHFSSLPPSCLSRCFLCQPGPTPAAPLIGQAAPPLPPELQKWAGLPEGRLGAFRPRRGLQGTSFERGTLCLPFLHSSTPPLPPGREGCQPTPGCLLLWLGLWAHPFPCWALIPGETTANAALWHRDTQHTLCSFGGFVLLCSESLLQAWGHLGAAPHNLAVAWNVEFALLSPPTFSDPQLRSHTSLGTLPGPLSVCPSWQRFTE